MTYRNRALLDLCHEAPCLLLPGQHECLGTPAEPCHSDMIRHGRGEHHKSHDCFAVPGCHNAHLAFTRSNLGKDGYHEAWTEAMERYILWQWVTGKVRLADITQRPKESTMEAPMCKICEHRHYVRDPHQFGKDAPAGPRAANGTKTVANPARSATRANSTASSTKNTSREGRRVLKAEGESPDATRTAGTPRPNPPQPPRASLAGKQTTAEKVTPGKRQTASKKKTKMGKKK